MHVLTLLLLASGATAAAIPANNGSKLSWTTCESLPGSERSLFQCATLNVPLDYQAPNSSANTLQLNLLKFPAQTQPSKGSVLYNPGGPGDSGRVVLSAGGGGQAYIVSAYAGFDYDIITWDPRGTGTTIPAVCFSNATARDALLEGIPSISPSDFNSSMPVAWELSASLAAACKTALNSTGTLLGSAYVARDMVEILDALGGDKLLRYYGESYGTALGQIFAAMFPERVDRMVLDGVLNPRQYIAGLDYQQLASTDAVWAGFLNACFERPSLCALASQNTTAINLAQQLEQAVEQLQNNPASFGSDFASVVTASMVRSIVLSTLYTPTSWTPLAAFLDAVLTKNLTAAGQALQFVSSNPGGSSNSSTGFKDLSNEETIPAIRCSDVSLRANSLAEVLPVASTFLNQSPQWASYLIAAQPLVCAQWPFTAKERYSGDFDVQTKNPILFVGNVFDPITSLDAARNASATFSGSGLLVHEGYGHTSNKQLSNCTISAVASYFSDGKLPQAGTVCLPDVPIFATQEELAASAKALLNPPTD